MREQTHDLSSSEQALGKIQHPFGPKTLHRRGGEGSCLHGVKSPENPTPNSVWMGRGESLPPKTSNKTGVPAPPTSTRRSPRLPAGAGRQERAVRGIQTRNKEEDPVCWQVMRTQPGRPSRPPQTLLGLIHGSGKVGYGVSTQKSAASRYQLHCFGQEWAILTGSCQRGSVYTGIQGARNTGHSLSHGARRPARHRLGKAAGRG